MTRRRRCPPCARWLQSFGHRVFSGRAPTPRSEIGGSAAKRGFILSTAGRACRRRRAGYWSFRRGALSSFLGSPPWTVPRRTAVGGDQILPCNLTCWRRGRWRDGRRPPRHPVSIPPRWPGSHHSSPGRRRGSLPRTPSVRRHWLLLRVSRPLPESRSSTAYQFALRVSVRRSTDGARFYC